MEKINILIITLLILTGILILSVFNFFQVTGNIISNQYTYTKAVCNSSNYCEDYKIACEGNNLVSFIPTGVAIQLGKDWKDSRNKELIKKLC